MENNKNKQKEGSRWMSEFESSTGSIVATVVTVWIQLQLAITQHRVFSFSCLNRIRIHKV